jgi:preprotein translocase subunit YajC
MLDLTHLFAGTVFAQTPASPAETPGGSPSSIGMSFLPLLLIFAVFYMLLIRPQQKKLEEQTKMIKALKRGDRVITAGGIHGKIVKLEGDDNLVVEIADGVQVKVVRSTVSMLAAKTEPVSTKSGEPGGDADKKD